MLSDVEVLVERDGVVLDGELEVIAEQRPGVLVWRPNVALHDGDLLRVDLNYTLDGEPRWDTTWESEVGPAMGDPSSSLDGAALELEFKTTNLSSGDEYCCEDPASCSSSCISSEQETVAVLRVHDDWRDEFLLPDFTEGQFVYRMHPGDASAAELRPWYSDPINGLFTFFKQSDEEYCAYLEVMQVASGETVRTETACVATPDDADTLGVRPTKLGEIDSWSRGRSCDVSAETIACELGLGCEQAEADTEAEAGCAVGTRRVDSRGAWVALLVGGVLIGVRRRLRLE